MRYLVLILMFLFLLPSFPARGAEMLDVDYNFIENAFSGIKPVTNKEFDDTINKLTPKPVENTFKGKLKAFFFGREYGIDAAPKGQDKELDVGGDKKAVEDIKTGTFYIKLVASVVSSEGQKIPAGNYKIKEEGGMLAFYQGSREYGKLPLQKFEDDKKGKHDIAYSRVDIISDDIVRIIYATLDDTKCANARVWQ